MSLQNNSSPQRKLELKQPSVLALPSPVPLDEMLRLALLRLPGQDLREALGWTLQRLRPLVCTAACGPTPWVVERRVFS